jgi:hypothetical protein
MGMSPREIEEKDRARRHKIRKKYYWSGLELRPKEPIENEPSTGTGGKLRGLLRRLPKVFRSQQ